MEPGNSRDIDFPICKAQVYAPHCGDIHAGTYFGQIPAQSPAQILVSKCETGWFEHGIKRSSVPWHCGDDVEVKIRHLSPAIMSLLFLAPSEYTIQGRLLSVEKRNKPYNF